MQNLSYDQGLLVPPPIEIMGRFTAGAYAQTASYTWSIASGTDLVVQAASAGAGGNDLDFTGIADGNQKASIDFDTYCVNADTIMELSTAGTDGNNWTVTMTAGSGTGEGVNINVDSVQKKIVIMYEDGVSTVTNLETAIGAASGIAVKTTGTGANVLASGSDDFYEQALSGGTAATWAEETVGPVICVVHYTNAVSTVTDCVNALKASCPSFTSTSSGVNTVASGDAVTGQSLSGGVTAVATSDAQGYGYTVSQTAVGQYVLTLERELSKFFSIKATLELPTARDVFPIVTSYSSKQISVRIWDISDVALADITGKIHFSIQGAI